MSFALRLLADPYAQKRDWVAMPWLDAQTRRLWQAVPGRGLVAALRMRMFVYRVRFAAKQLPLNDAQALQREIAKLRMDLRRRGFNDGLNAKAFAIIRHLSKDALGVSHFDSQLRGAWVLLSGRLAEMATGEGKTLTATLAAATAALAGLPVHVVTVNDYLAQRDMEKLSPLYAALGLSTGLVTEEMSQDERRAAYRNDIVYCSNKTVVFDYLRDRNRLGARMSPLTMALDDMVSGSAAQGGTTLRGLHFAIVDEADSVFIDEARTPLILSATEDGSAAEAYYREAIALAMQIEVPRHATMRPEGMRMELTDAGRALLTERSVVMAPIWHAAMRRQETIEQALNALHVYRRDIHYIVRDDKVMIVDENTGRVMADRSWERGLHQMIEVKEGVKVSDERHTLARISYQLFFRRYMRLSGMSGTVREVGSEVADVYGLGMVRVPTRLPLKRKYLASQLYASADEKWQAVVKSIHECLRRGQPVLVGTRSIMASEQLSKLLTEMGVMHQVLNAKQDEDEARVVERAGEVGAVTIATSMAGRGTDIAPPAAALKAGGLHVILTEGHDNARVDRQLQGRCARQGDPGSCEAILSMDDEVVRERGGWLARFLRGWLAQQPNAWLPRQLGLLCYRVAQKRIEHEHGIARRRLLGADFQNRQSLSFSGQME